MRVLITRPRAEAAVLAADLAARGHEVTIEPLLTIEPLPGVVAALAGAQAIVLTSANAVPALPATGVRLPVFAVGAATARAARAHGCEEVHAAAGDAQSLARLIGAHCRPAAGPLLHLAGAEVRPGLAEALARRRLHPAPPDRLSGGRRARPVGAGGRGAPPPGDRRRAAVLASHRDDPGRADRRAPARRLPRPDRGDLPQRRGRRALPSPGVAGGARSSSPGGWVAPGAA